MRQKEKNTRVVKIKLFSIADTVDVSRMSLCGKGVVKQSGIDAFVRSLD